MEECQPAERGWHRPGTSVLLGILADSVLGRLWWEEQLLAVEIEGRAGKPDEAEADHQQVIEERIPGGKGNRGVTAGQALLLSQMGERRAWKDSQLGVHLTGAGRITAAVWTAKIVAIVAAVTRRSTGLQPGGGMEWSSVLYAAAIALLIAGMLVHEP